jgi:hypothetical protein
MTGKWLTGKWGGKEQTAALAAGRDDHFPVLSFPVSALDSGLMPGLQFGQFD